MTPHTPHGEQLYQALKKVRRILAGTITADWRDKELECSAIIKDAMNIYEQESQPEEHGHYPYLAKLRPESASTGEPGWERIEKLLFDDDFKQWRNKEGWQFHNDSKYWYKLTHASQWPPHGHNVKFPEELKELFESTRKPTLPESSEVKSSPNNKQWPTVTDNDFRKIYRSLEVAVDRLKMHEFQNREFIEVLEVVLNENRHFKI